ncbi:MAG: DUF3987 domain-containing protein [Burkholderiales bacterium]|nr:DUF3987 domain-containing protein [Burkholderiales bacterium]
MTPAAIADALGGARRDGAGYVALCPCHADTHPSLALHLGDDGRLLWHCRAGCPQDAIRDALAGRGLLNGREHVPAPRRAPRAATAPTAASAPIPEGEPDMTDTRMGAPSDSWCYRSAEGMPLYYVARYQTPAGKSIRPWTRDGSHWRQRAYPAPRPLYGLDRLAARPDAPVLIAEGERCADAAHVALGAEWVCITWAGGAAAVRKSDWTPLRGRRVLVWPDRDDPGRRAAEDIRRILPGADVLDVPGDDGWDIADLLDAEGAEAVRRYVAECARVAAPARVDAARIAVMSDDADGWPEPAPLPSGLLPVATFSADLLPDPLRTWVADIAERTQCPPEYPAVGALVALGSVLGRRLAVRPKLRDDWHEFANLWGVVIGPPGVLKSPALAEALRPLRKLEAIAYEQHEHELGAWRADREAARIHRDAARDNARKAARKGMQFDAAALVLDDEADEPQPRRYVVNDCTPEALGVVLARNPNGVLAYRDELAGLLASMDREGMEGARQFYLSAYSAKEPYTFDRITRGRTRIEACCVSLLGSSQPAVISRYIRDAVTHAGGDGLLSRFSLLVWPDMPAQWRDVDRWPESAAREQVHALFERLDRLSPAAMGAEGEAEHVPYLRYDDAARELFLEWRTALEGRLRDPSSTEHPAFIVHLAKYRKLVPALALLFHVAEVGSGAIAEPSVLRALAWAELLESHARRAYGAIAQANADGARALLAKLRAGKLASPFVLRDAYRAAWAGLTDPEHVRHAAEMLAEYDYLRAEAIQTGGRPRVQYTLSPRALE